MVFRFPLPFMPPFFSFNFAGIPELIGAFTLGALYLYHCNMNYCPVSINRY